MKDTYTFFLFPPPSSFFLLSSPPATTSSLNLPPSYILIPSFLLKKHKYGITNNKICNFVNRKFIFHLNSN